MVTILSSLDFQVTASVKFAGVIFSISVVVAPLAIERLVSLSSTFVAGTDLLTNLIPLSFAYVSA
jgi:hypothetical protein